MDRFRRSWEESRCFGCLGTLRLFKTGFCGCRLFRLFRLLAYLNYTRRTPLHARSPVIFHSRTRLVARVPIGKTPMIAKNMHPSNFDSYVMASRPCTWAADFELVVGEEEEEIRPEDHAQSPRQKNASWRNVDG